MSELSFAKRIQAIMGNSIPDCVPRGTWNGVEYKHIYRDLRENSIDGIIPEHCIVKGTLTDCSGAPFSASIKYHLGARHMNSSQMMCINFFKAFFEEEDRERALLSALIKSGLSIPDEASIEAAAFEYEPDRAERTNFDFFIKLDNGSHISFEVKYTESEFGGVKQEKSDSGKYERKWHEIYSSRVRNPPVLKHDMEDFYGNYQINRNILYASGNDQTVFLTPRANDSKGITEGRAYIDRLGCSRIVNVYWEDLAANILDEASCCPKLKKYFEAFNTKYIAVLSKQ